MSIQYTVLGFEPTTFRTLDQGQNQFLVFTSFLCRTLPLYRQWESNYRQFGWPQTTRAAIVVVAKNGFFFKRKKKKRERDFSPILNLFFHFKRRKKISANCAKNCRKFIGTHFHIVYLFFIFCYRRICFCSSFGM